MQAIQDLLENFTLSENVPENLIHNTEVLLNLYRKIEFAVKCHLRELDEELYVTERKRLSDFVHDLINCDLSKERQRLQDRLTSADTSLCLLELMEDALLLLKSYPDNGELYYKLLRYRFFDSYGNTNEELMEILNLSRSTYYRQKKKAIILFASVLWSLSLPKPPDNVVNTCQNKAS